MIDIKIHKKDISKQLWPLSFDGILVFNFSFMDNFGLFGIKDNHLILVDDKDIPEEMAIQIPENTEEVLGFLGSAEYILHRFMMTPNPVIIGFNDSEVTEKEINQEVIRIFTDFINRYNKNASLHERAKNYW